MLNQLLIQIAKVLSRISQTFNLGNGSTWPGHIALSMRPHIIEDILKESTADVILIVGTNGKTTTGKILTTILESTGKNVIQNTSGANLLNGIASTLLLNTNSNGQLAADYAVFEVDENNLPLILAYITPKQIIALDLFRDQLDRYGELDSIAKKWNAAFQKLTKITTLVLNADDPLIANIGISLSGKGSSMIPNVVYFGLTEKEKGQKKLEHAADSVYCPNCGYKLTYKKVFYSHLGIWECPHCHAKRPLPSLLHYSSPLPGTYNTYNTYAATLAAQKLDIPENHIKESLQKVQPAFGRQEKLTYEGKHIQLFLSKNPISMNESLKTIINLSSESSLALKKGEGQGEGSSRPARTIKLSILFVLNDRIPDGLDVSWIWDIDLEKYMDKFTSITISGDRCYDMALRVQYAQNSPTSQKFLIEPNLQEAINKTLSQVSLDETLYILPTYSAMLDVRKILTGRSIL